MSVIVFSNMCMGVCMQVSAVFGCERERVCVWVGERECVCGWVYGALEVE